MSGRWVFVCGPSGAGKDSVIAWAREALRHRHDIVFARRLITRPAHPASDHAPVGDAEFDALLAGDDLAWHWQAHGVRYGIPAVYRADVAAGRQVVVNGSREHLASLDNAPALRAVLVTAPADVLAERLRQRARDSEASIAQRAARHAGWAALRVHHSIVNDGAIARAGATLAQYLARVASAGSDVAHLAVQ